MKKIKLFIAALVLASAVVAISINSRTSNDPFFEANLEALADIENTPTCVATLACDMVNPAYNYVSCTGHKECHRYPVQRYVECDGVVSSCNG